MVAKTIYVDDIDGSEDAQTVRFGYEDKTYEIDLSEENRRKLAQLLGPYLEHGREVTVTPEVAVPAQRRRGGSARQGETRQDLAAIRAWAKENGYTVSDRGRVKQEVIDAYDRAHSATPRTETQEP